MRKQKKFAFLKKILKIFVLSVFSCLPKLISHMQILLTLMSRGSVPVDRSGKLDIRKPPAYIYRAPPFDLENSKL